MYVYIRKCAVCMYFLRLLRLSFRKNEILSHFGIIATKIYAYILHKRVMKA